MACLFILHIQISQACSHIHYCHFRLSSKEGDLKLEVAVTLAGLTFINPIQKVALAIKTFFLFSHAYLAKAAKLFWYALLSKDILRAHGFYIQANST